MLTSPTPAGGHPAAATQAGCTIPIPGASTLAAAAGVAAWRFPHRWHLRCSGCIPVLGPRWPKGFAGVEASGSAFDLQVLTRFQMSRSNDCPPPPRPGRGDNTSEPARTAAIALLYGALIAANHAAHSRQLQKQRAGPATPCAKSAEPGFPHTHVPARAYAQGSPTRLFAPSHLHASKRVGFGRPSRLAQVDVKLAGCTESGGLGPSGLSCLACTGGHWVALGCPRRCVSSRPRPRCAVVPSARAFGVSAVQTPVMLARQGDARSGREGLRPPSARSPAAWELTGGLGGKRRKRVRTSSAPPCRPPWLL